MNAPVAGVVRSSILIFLLVGSIVSIDRARNTFAMWERSRGIEVLPFSGGTAFTEWKWKGVKSTTPSMHRDWLTRRSNVVTFPELGGRLNEVNFVVEFEGGEKALFVLFVDVLAETDRIRIERAPFQNQPSAAAMLVLEQNLPEETTLHIEGPSEEREDWRHLVKARVCSMGFSLRMAQKRDRYGSPKAGISYWCE